LLVHFATGTPSSGSLSDADNQHLIVSRIEREIILMRFQLRSMISVPESQPSAILIYVLETEMFNAWEGALGTRDHQ